MIVFTASTTISFKFYTLLIRPFNLPLQLQLINFFGLLYKVRNRILRKTH